MAAYEQAAPRPATRGWPVVLEQELRDLWVGGRGLLLTLAFSGLLSLIAYLVATNTDLNFLEQREAVGLVLQVTIAVGSLLALLAAADAVSGERERGTLENLLLTPVSRVELGVGKLLAALSLWFAALAVAVPYVWYLGRGVDVVDEALASGIVVGTLLAVFLASLGLILRPRRTGSASPSVSSSCSRSTRRRSSRRARGAGGRATCYSASTRSRRASTTSAESWSTRTRGAKISPGSSRRSWGRFSSPPRRSR
jgi:ABC-type transport system involved in cytochrome c biogenesis permease component